MWAPHANNKIHEPGIENAVKHLDATPGLNIVLEPGTGNGAIDISNERFQGDVAGLGGWDNGPFVKLDPKNSSFDPADRTEIAGHELLHAIGLDHNDSGCSIMASVVNRCGEGPSPLGKAKSANSTRCISAKSRKFGVTLRQHPAERRSR
ncbi:hypothetical protein [Nocardia brasiliensis]|uniref:hypothetical protein n=1 Tax=Nocardia brasiliensis TaxID=37326 RepID=UPI0024544C60|nr:hypothetical protein [Nocardia brasiliensis]